MLMMNIWTLICLVRRPSADCGDDYDVNDGGGGERNILMISVIMIMIDGINDGDDEYLNSYLLGSQT